MLVHGATSAHWSFRFVVPILVDRFTLYAVDRRGRGESGDRGEYAIERGRLWQAEYMISGLRDQTLALACGRLGEPPAYARGVDRLPPEVLGAYEATLIRSPETGELRRALAATTELFLDEVAAVDAELAERLRDPLVEAAAGVG